jgi:hypothetical protein
MCPFCMVAIGQIVAGVVSAGGLTAVAVKLSLKKSNAKRNSQPKLNRKEQRKCQPELSIAGKDLSQ